MVFGSEVVATEHANTINPKGASCTNTAPLQAFAVHPGLVNTESMFVTQGGLLLIVSDVASAIPSHGFPASFGRS